MFQWLGSGTTRRDWFCGLTDDIDQQSEFHKIDLGDFYWVNCTNNEEAIKAYETLKGMGYSSSDNVRTRLEEYYFVYVYKIRSRYPKTRQKSLNDTIIVYATYNATNQEYQRSN